MGTGTGIAAGVGRDLGYPLVHQISRACIFSENGTAKQMGTLPAGAVVVRAYIVVATLFNDSGTDLFTFGSTTTANEIVSTGISGAATGVVSGTVLGTFAIPTVDTALYVKYAGQNSDMTTGAATAVVEYISRVG